MRFGGRKKRRRLLLEQLEGDQPQDRLVTAVHGGSLVVIDGDGAANLGWPHLPVNRQREALVEYCGVFAADLDATAAALHLFFDLSVEDVVPRSKKVVIEMVPDRITAAERALERVETAVAGSGSPVAIWADDPNGASLRAAGASLFSLDVLLDCFIDL